jgi:pimeloyl-ACP methyl ester carboxylesterase
MEQISFRSGECTLTGCLFEAAVLEPKAVVFCHGAFEDQQNWQPYASRMAGQCFSAFTFDFTGHGLSEGIRSTVDMEVWAYNLRDGLNYLARRGYQRFAVVGFGHGGSAGLLAAAHDDRIACLAALAAPVSLIPPLPERIAYSAATLASRIKKKIKHTPFTLSRVQELGDLEILADESANATYLARPELRDYYTAVPIPECLHSVWMDITRSAKRVNTPVLILHGAKDRMIKIKQSQTLAGILPAHKHLEIMPESGHALHLDVEKEEVYKQIARWVKRYLN